MSGRMRTIVFVVILLAAAVVAGRSLLMKAETQAGCDAGGFGVVGVGFYLLATIGQ